MRPRSANGSPNTVWIPAKFKTAFESFGVNNQVNQAESMVDAYKVEGVPALTVDGKYLVLGDNFPQVLANADAVIAMDRQQKATAAANHK